MRVLGIDPSLQSTGFGIIESKGSELIPVAHGIIKPASKASFHHKLDEIRSEIENLIDSFEPEEVSIENPFFARNVKTAFILGQVRGAVLVGVAGRKRNLFEYSALEIKKSVTGYGQAGKDQVQIMVRSLLNLEDDPIPLDASDALAAAICHLNTRMFQISFEEKREP